VGGGFGGLGSTRYSEHRGEKGSGEIGGVYLPTQLERTHHNLARDGR
jgi:hypothetical protein